MIINTNLLKTFLLKTFLLNTFLFYTLYNINLNFFISFLFTKLTLKI